MKNIYKNLIENKKKELRIPWTLREVICKISQNAQPTTDDISNPYFRIQNCTYNEDGNQLEGIPSDHQRWNSGHCLIFMMRTDGCTGDQRRTAFKADKRKSLEVIPTIRFWKIGQTVTTRIIRKMTETKTMHLKHIPRLMLETGSKKMMNELGNNIVYL